MALPEEREPAGAGRVQLRQPRIAEMIAAVLRERIVSGDLADGETLSKQDELLDEFDVSRPSLREALRILETEGLITVRRGNLGGAVVHAPTTESAAYMLGLVLQANGVTVADLAESLRGLEPACAALCAQRPDRDAAVVPELRALIEESAAAIDDPVAFTALARRWHDRVVELSGNRTMRLVAGTIVSLWSAHEEDWAAAADARAAYPDVERRRASVRARRAIVDAVERGDALAASTLLWRHLGAAQRYVLTDPDERVSVTQRRPGWPPPAGRRGGPHR